jgi:hypothetical protein
MIAVITRAFQISNYVEAGLWISIGIGFTLAALRQTGIARRHCWIAAVDFILFGISDLVEATTGAWYRPWWLLIWKVLCLLVFAWLVISYIRRRRLAE